MSEEEKEEERGHIEHVLVVGRDMMSRKEGGHVSPRSVVSKDITLLEFSHTHAAHSRVACYIVFVLLDHLWVSTFLPMTLPCDLLLCFVTNV